MGHLYLTLYCKEYVIIHSFIHSFIRSFIQAVSNDLKKPIEQNECIVKALQTYRTRRMNIEKYTFRDGWLSGKYRLSGKGKGTANAVGADQHGWNNPVEVKKYFVLVGGLKMLVEWRPVILCFTRVVKKHVLVVDLVRSRRHLESITTMEWNHLQTTATDLHQLILP